MLYRISGILQTLFSGKNRKFFRELHRILGFTPFKLKFYKIAFVHKSASESCKGGLINNERLEFLGDAILDAVIADYLFIKFPKKDEGFLTQLRSKIVNREMLNHLAVETGISQYVKSNTNNNHKHIFGDAFEAFIGAIYIDRGYKKTKNYIIKSLLKTHIDLKELIETETDFKSRIIEWGQKNKQEINFLCSEDPTSTEKKPIFVSCIKMLDEIIGQGSGTSKKEAEQNAAEQALSKIIV